MSPPHSQTNIANNFFFPHQHTRMQVFFPSNPNQSKINKILSKFLHLPAFTQFFFFPLTAKLFVNWFCYYLMFPIILHPFSLEPTPIELLPLAFYHNCSCQCYQWSLLLKPMARFLILLDLISSFDTFGNSLLFEIIFKLILFFIFLTTLIHVHFWLLFIF